MLSKNNSNKKKVHRALALTILSLSLVSLIITMSAPDYSRAQVSDSQNATTTSGIPSSTTEGMNTTSPTTTARGENQSATAEVRTLVEQARIAVQNNDIQGALMNFNSALVALEGGGNGEQGNNMTATPNEVTDSTTATEAGTISNSGAGGAGTAGGIMTGGST